MPERLEFVGNFEVTEFERPSFSYVDMSSIFHLKDVNYTRQFAHIYAHRLVQMRDILQSKIHQKWGSYYNIIMYLLLFMLGYEFLIKSLIETEVHQQKYINLRI